MRDAVALCRDAEELGYTDAWSAEVAGADGLAALAALAQATESIRVGTAIVPVYTRPPALLAMGAATLQDLSRGRFVLGLGTSSSIIVEKWMGAPFRRPLSRLREYVEILQDALTGKKVSFAGDTVNVGGFRLQIDAGAPVPIYLAALGPRACRLAGEIADGVILFLRTPEGVVQSLDWVADGARAAGRDPDELDCVIRIPVALDEDPAVFGFVARRMITAYATVDVYHRSLAAQGFEHETRSIADAWGRGDRDAANRLVTDEMVDRLIVSGDEHACRTRLQAFRDAGVKTPVLLPFSVAGDPQERTARVRAAVEALAP